MYTTACVMKELRGMGKDFGPTTRAAGNYEIHKCGHTKGESKPAAECIMEQIGGAGQPGGGVGSVGAATGRVRGTHQWRGGSGARSVHGSRGMHAHASRQGSQGLVVRT